ncbi:PREDICTED: ABC transporter G family member 26-like [Nicotiana attenuata]|uniref:ABC transporter G family member 26-like n=1 Tax=Nicotiana attenuata TaxID=49451 RepID=UPI000904F0B1|nr:PREDICTED: ABC transporter G family member 26-like [Nicotiana attenuata]
MKGEILALMGPFGSGKTTLLKILGGRLQENVRGTVTYNDIPYNTAINRRLPSKMSGRQKYERAEVIIKELGLERCPYTRIGVGLIIGISGGERKRTSIGYEILVDPSLFLLDEPTSGLDSSSVRKERVGSPFRLSGGASQSIGQRMLRFDFVSRDPPQVGFESRVMGDYPARFGEHFLSALVNGSPLSSKKEAALPRIFLNHFVSAGPSSIRNTPGLTMT